MRGRRYSLLFFVLAGTACLAGSEPMPSDPLDLDQAIGFALIHNFAIRQARERIREQEGVLTTVAAAGLPTVSASGSFQRSSIQSFQQPTPGAFVVVPSGRYWRMSLAFRQALYAGGGIVAATDAATLGRDAAVLQLKIAIDDTVRNVRLRYFAVLLARAQIGVQEQNLASSEQQLRDATVRFAVGAVSEFERLRAEVALANAKPPLIQARNELRIATEEFYRVIGFVRDGSAEPANGPEITGNLNVEPIRIELLEALQSAREHRPELQRLAKLVAAAEAGQRTVRSDVLPKVGLSGGGELRKGPSERFSDSLRGLKVGVDAQWSVPSRATTGRNRQTESSTEQARLALQEAELTVQVEVRRALAALELAAESVAATGKAESQAEEAVRIARVRYQAGTAVQLDLLQAQSSLTAARTNRLRAEYDHNVARAELQRAVGESAVLMDMPPVETRRPSSLSP